MSGVRVGIVNVTGYAGVELARLLLRHPQVEVVSVTGRGEAGKRLPEVFPHLAELDLPIEAEVCAPVDVAFIALPHKAAAEAVPPLLARGARVVDISADFRLHDRATYEQWYKVTHPCPELLDEAVYGLTELHRGEIRGARIVANPGCYPTAALLGLLPALGLIEPDVIVDAKSGVSGGGRSLTLANHYSEVNENCQAYALAGHRHQPEISQELDWALQRMANGAGMKVLFLPHLVPMTRGILATCYARLKQPASAAEVRARYETYYAGEPFVRVTAAPPQTKQTWGSNLCLVYPTVDERSQRLVVISCLDNLVKGASGQAIQNMNVMFGLPECTGIDVVPVYP
ncbi:MAG: N-acetyl-gamma-glutamyl-phosphate reductase [Chloroflexi bacterium]|nr:N-acetyl-gamma-glutamyl-phosphate reductase [Chloroflexota bacterium]